MGPNVIHSHTRRQASGPLLQAAIHRRAPSLERALELLGVLALKKTSEFGLQCCERRCLIGGKRLARGGERRPYAQRRCCGDLIGKINGALELFIGRCHLLDKTQALPPRHPILRQ